MENKSFEREVIERLTALETLIKSQDYGKIGTEVTENSLKIEQCEKRLDELESTNKWLVRLIIGAVIGGILAFVYGIK